MLNFILALLAFYFIDGVGPAHAGPIIGAIVAIGNVLGGLGIVGKILLTVGLAIGQTMLQKALAKKNKPQDQIQGADLEVKMGDDQPVSTTLGTYATAGKRKYIGAWGKVNNTPNSYLVDVLELGNLPVGGLVELWINDKKCTLDTSSPEPGGLGYPIAEFTDDGKVYGWWKFYDGTQTVADDYLIAKFGSHEDRPWKNTMIGRGVPYIILTYRLNQKLYSNSLPSATIVTRGAKLYDIRKDSTEGGSGAHRWNNQATWEPSDNPFVQAYNIARGMSYNGKWFYGGQNVSTKRLPRAAWIAAMNACDMLRNLEGGGTEKMFRSGIELKGENEPLAIIDYLRGAANGRIVEIGGKLKPFAGELGAAEAAFTDADIIITEGQTFEPFPILDDIFNGATATYPEPAEKWASKDAPPYYVADLEEEDGARRLVAALQYPAVPYPTQVQALMRTAVEEGRRFRMHQFWLPPAYWGLEPGDVVTWTSNINGYDNKKFIVLTCEGELTYNQLVTLREVDPLDYSWSPTFQRPVIVGPVGPVVLPTQLIPGWSVVESSFSDSAGDPRRPAIAIAAASDIDDLRAIKIQIVHVATGELVHTRELPYVIDEDYQWTITGSFLLPGEQYQVRGIQVPFSTRNVDWTGWTTVTMFPLAFGTKDVLDNAITAGKIAEAAVTAGKIMDAAITELKLANLAVSTAKLKLAAVTADILANNAVIATKIADGAVNVAKFATGIEPVTISTSPTLPTTKSTTNITWQGELYTWNGTAYAKPSFTIADNSITTAKIANAAIIADKLANGAVTHDKISAGSIYGDVVAAGAITAKHLVVTDFSNILPDSDLTDIANWTQNGAANFNIVNGGANENASRVIIQQLGAITTGTPGAFHSDIFSSYFPVEPGKPLLFGGTIRTQSTNLAGNLGLYIHFYDKAGVEVPSSFSSVFPDMSGITTEQPLSNRIAAPSAGVKARLRLRRSYASGTGQIGGTTYAYNLFVRRAANAELIVDGSIIADKLAASAVTADKIAANAITAGKIAAGAVSAAEIAAGAITASKLFIGETSNVFPDFDMVDNAYYSASGGVSWGLSYTSTGYSGLRQLSVEPSTTSQQVASGHFTLNQSSDYYFEGVARVATASTILINLYTKDASGNYVYTRSVTLITGPVSARQSASFTTTSSEVAGRLIFRAEANATGTAWFSGPVIRRKAMGELIVDGAITAIKIAANTITATQIAAGAITATELASNSVTAIKIAAGTITGDKIAANTIGANLIAADAITAKHLVLTDFENLVANGYFSDNANANIPEYWVPNASASLWHSTNSLTGARSLAIEKAVLTSSAYFDASNDKMFAVTTGDRLYGEIAVDANATATAGFYFRVMWFDANKVALTTTPSTDFVSNAAVSTSYPMFKGVIDVPGGARFGRVRIYNHSTNTTASIFYIDRIVIRRMRGADLIVDGTITTDMLAANAITAAKIAVGTITADRIVLNGITTDRIAPEAITDAAGARTAAAISCPANVETSIQSVVVSGITGSFAQITGSFLVGRIGQDVSNNGTYTDIGITIRLYRGSTLTHSITTFLSMIGLKSNYDSTGAWYMEDAYFGGLQPVLLKDDTPANGSNTYSIRVVPDRALSITERNLFAAVVKR